MFKYAGLRTNDCVNGTGICVSFWTQGCPFHCEGCHNPETWDPEGGMPYTKEVEEKIISAIDANNIKRNFSILGGEPFSEYSILLVLHLIGKVRKKFPNIKIYIWTGFLYEQLITDEVAAAILENADFLIDGRYISAQRDLNLKLRGSANQRVIDLKKTRAAGKVITVD